MNVIVLERYPSSQRGGQERSLLDVTRQLAERGHRITLVHAHSGDLLPQYEAFCDRIIAVRGFDLSLREWRSSLWFVADLWKVWFQIRSQPEQTVIYINQPYDSPFAALLSQVKQFPIVCHLRLPAPRKLGIQRKLTLHCVQQFMAVSEATRQGWLAQVKGPITTIHNGMVPERYMRKQSIAALRDTWKIAQTDRVISYIGRLDHMKGLRTLLTAFASILTTHPPTQLLIAGKPLQSEESYFIELEQLARSLGIQERVRFLGHIEQTLEILHLSDLAVVPSQWAEPCARSIIEAMMAGTPVLASRVGGNIELLGDEFSNGLFTARDVDDLSTKIRSYINWRSEDSQLGDRYQAYAQQKFSLEDKIDAIEDVLMKVVTKPSFEGDHYAANPG